MSYEIIEETQTFYSVISPEGDWVSSFETRQEAEEAIGYLEAKDEKIEND